MAFTLALQESIRVDVSGVDSDMPNNSRDRSHLPFRAIICIGITTSLVTGCTQPAAPAATIGVEDKSSTELESQSPQSHDFGIVQPSSTHAHVFEVHNRSNDVIRIKEISTSCRCTEPLCEAELIPVGEFIPITVRYRAAAKSGNDHQHVTVRFDPPTYPAAKFVVTARVRASMTVVPEVVELSQSSDDAAFAGSVTVLNYSTTDWGKLDVQCDAKLRVVTVNLSPQEANASGARQGWKTDFLYDGDAPAERPIQFQVKFCGGSDGVNLTESVSVRVPAKKIIRPIPSRAFFGTIARGRVSTTVIQFPSTEIAQLGGTRGIAIRSECRLPLTFDWISADGISCNLSISVRAEMDDAPGLLNGWVALTYPNGQTTTIPVQGFIE